MGFLDSLFGRKDPQQPVAGDSVSLLMRDTLFGDMPLDRWKAEGTAEQQPPWRQFAQAREHLKHGEKEPAIARWREVIMEPGLEPRLYLQAWHFLRSQGEMPPPDLAQRVLGVIVEVMLPDGLDIVAAYSDHSARYYNHRNGSVIWERPDASLDGAIDALHSAGARVVAQIGPSNEPQHPPPPPLGQTLLSFLTPGGLHYGQGGINTFSNDPKGGPVLKAAFELMQALMAKTGKA